VISEETRWPSAEISGRQGGFSWPSLWRFSWPPTCGPVLLNLCGSASPIRYPRVIAPSHSRVTLFDDTHTNVKGKEELQRMDRLTPGHLRNLALRLDERCRLPRRRGDACHCG